MHRAGAEFARGAGCDAVGAEPGCALRLRRADWVCAGVADAYLSGAGGGGHQVFDESFADECGVGGDRGCAHAAGDH